MFQRLIMPTLQQKWRKFRYALANDIVTELSRGAPVDTGNLKLGISQRIKGNVIEIFMPDYALYVEFGTAPHIIRPKNAKALHWKSGGNDIFAKVVHHPGTRPQPFIRPVLRNLGRLVQKNLKVFTE